MTRAELISLLVDATPEVPVADADTLCRAAADMLDIRDAILASVATLDGALDRDALAELERRDRAWHEALAGHLGRVGELRAASAKTRAYRQNPRR